MKIKKASFETTIVDVKKINNTSIPEIAFVGRSNVGKSSLINMITNINRLAKTSSTPGKTKHLNYFLINDDFYIVDLPGYGYHKASKTDEKKWKSLIEDYLTNSKNLMCVFVLLDIRRTPSDLDIQMIDYLYQYNIPFSVIITKSDKISKSQVNILSNKIAINLGLGTSDVIISSSTSKKGKEEILSKIFSYINN